jgi:hypothetical protein
MSLKLLQLYIEFGATIICGISCSTIPFVSPFRSINREVQNVYGREDLNINVTWMIILNKSVHIFFYLHFFFFGCYFLLFHNRT